eukprot:6044102-Amphidinium_carterae.1
MENLGTSDAHTTYQAALPQHRMGEDLLRTQRRSHRDAWRWSALEAPALHRRKCRVLKPRIVVPVASLLL